MTTSSTPAEDLDDLDDDQLAYRLRDLAHEMADLADELVKRTEAVSAARKKP